MDKEAFSYKLSGRSVDIINLLRARSPHANHRRAFNLGIHKYHDAERRRREFSRKQEAIAPSARFSFVASVTVEIHPRFEAQIREVPLHFGKLALKLEV